MSYGTGPAADAMTDTEMDSGNASAATALACHGATPALGARESSPSRSVANAPVIDVNYFYRLPTIILAGPMWPRIRLACGQLM